MTTQPKPPDIALQFLAAFESLIDVCAEKAVARHLPVPVEKSLWVSAREAAEILGEGYTVERVRHMGREGLLVMDRKEPDSQFSPYIFERASLYRYSSRRVFEIDQAKP